VEVVVNRLLLLSLLACGTEPERGPWAPPAPPTLTVGDLARGSATTLRADGLFPGEKVTFLVSVGGLGPGPCHPSGAPCVDLQGPVTLLGTRFADANGVAGLTLTVPDTVPVGARPAFQAITVLNDGASASTVSNAVVAEVLDACALLTCGPGSCAVGPAGAACVCPPGLVATANSCNDPFDGVVDVGPITFDVRETSYISLATLPDGTVNLVYRAGPSGAFNVATVDADGSFLVSPRAFDHANRGASASTRTGAVVVHSDPLNNGAGTLHLFDALAQETIPPVVFAPLADTMDVAELANGNLLVAHGAFGANLTVVRPTGAIIGNRLIDNELTDEFAIAPLSDGNALVAWTSESVLQFDGIVRYAIVSPTGVPVFGPAGLSPDAFIGGGFHLDAVAYDDDSVLVVFSDMNGDARYARVQGDGTLIQPPTLLSDGFVTSIAAAPAGGAGDLAFVSWRDRTAGNAYLTTTIDRDGTVAPPAVFSSVPPRGQTSATPLPDGRVMLGFTELGTGSTPYPGTLFLFE
jgi:hypothetical protein